MRSWRSPSTLESTTSPSGLPLTLDLFLGFEPPAVDSFAVVDLVLPLSGAGSAAGLGDSGTLGLAAFSDVALDLCFSVAGAGVVGTAPDLDLVLITTRVLDLDNGLGGGDCDT